LSAIIAAGFLRAVGKLKGSLDSTKHRVTNRPPNKGRTLQYTGSFDQTYPVMSSLEKDLSIAWRNVARQGRRSSVAVAAIAFGVVALVMAGGFIDWLLTALRESTINAQIGHIQVLSPGYRENGVADPFRYLLPEQSPEQSAIAGMQEVKVMGARLSFSGLISHGDSTLSFIADGVEASKEELLSTALVLKQGERLSDDDPLGIIVGNGLATNLGVRVGDVVVLMTTTAAGGINAVECRIRGVFATATKAYDDSALRVPIVTARKLLKIAGSHVWVLRLNKTEQTAEVLADMRSRYAGRPLEFIPWSDLADYYNKTVNMLNSQLDVIKLIIGMIIVLSISNTLMMNVMERRGEIGTAMALGVGRSSIRRQFLIEGAILGLLGGGIGAVSGALLATLISAIGIPMPPPPGMESGYTAEILNSAELTAEALILAVGTTVLAGLYPSWKASRMNIVDALRVNR
jgi:putative ABC transport system permease protein